MCDACIYCGSTFYVGGDGICDVCFDKEAELWDDDFDYEGLDYYDEDEY